MSCSSTALYGWRSRIDGSFVASAFRRSCAKKSWICKGCSHHSVPSLSNVAIRRAGGTKSGPPAFVTRATKSRIADFDDPGFHGRQQIVHRRIRHGYPPLAVACISLTASSIVNVFGF